MVHTRVNRGNSEKELLINQIATKVTRWGLRLPMMIALEAGRPVSFVLAQLLWVAQPISALANGHTLMGDLASLLEEPDAVNLLIEQLEAR